MSPECAKRGCEEPATFILHTGGKKSWPVCSPHLNQAMETLLQVAENPTLIRVEAVK